MTFIDLFAGVGGFRKGLELAGHKCLGFCEYDKFAVQSYRAIHNTEGEWYAKDIREVRAADIPRADMWCAGFPCQDISICGKQLGFKGKRSSLFFAVTSLVADLEEKDRPYILFFENVKNLLSVNRGFDFADVVPQNRERVFIIASIRGRDRPKVFPIEESNREADELQRLAAGTLTTRTGQSNAVGTYVVESQQFAQKTIGGLYSNVSERFQRGILPDCSRTLKADKHDACVAIFQRPHGNNKDGVHNIAPTLTANYYQQNNVAIKTSTKAGFEFARVNRDSINLAFPDSKTRRGRVGKDKAHTLDTTCNQGIIQSDLQIRKLTPLECWRLQGWSDEDFFKAFFLDKELGIRFNKLYQKYRDNPVRIMKWAFKHQKMSDSQLYKQAGNGVTVTVIQRIGEKLNI